MMQLIMTRNTDRIGTGRFRRWHGWVVSGQGAAVAPTVGRGRTRREDKARRAGFVPSPPRTTLASEARAWPAMDQSRFSAVGGSAARIDAMTLRLLTADNRSRLAALLGATTGIALALALGADVAGALAWTWNSVVVPAYHALSLSGFTTCF